MYNIELLLSSVFVVNVLTHYRKKDFMTTLNTDEIVAKEAPTDFIYITNLFCCFDYFVSTENVAQIENREFRYEHF